MISRSRSVPTVEAMSIEWTTSANNTVTCLYSAGVVAVATAAPHSLQNFAFGGSSVPHDPHAKAAAVMSRGQPTVVHVTIVSPLSSYTGRPKEDGGGPINLSDADTNPLQRQKSPKKPDWLSPELKKPEFQPSLPELKKPEFQPPLPELKKPVL